MDGRTDGTDGKTFLSSDNTNVGFQNARFQMQQMNYVMWTCLPNIVGRFSGLLGFLALLCLLIFMVVLYGVQSSGNIGVTTIGFDVGGRCAFGCLQKLFVKRRPEEEESSGLLSWALVACGFVSPIVFQEIKDKDSIWLKTAAGVLLGRRFYGYFGWAVS